MYNKRMCKDLLLVIDMQNVYASGGAWCCPGTESAADRIKEFIRREKENIDVIFTRFLSDGNATGVWQDYNRENEKINRDAYANEMMEVFSDELKLYPLYTKSVYSSLEIPEVRDAVKKAERVIVTGVVAECCILFTVTALIDAGVRVLYLKDCIAGLNTETEEAAVTVLSGLDPLHVRIMDSSGYAPEI